MSSGMKEWNIRLYELLITFVALNTSPNTLELWGLCEDKDLLEPKSAQFGIDFVIILFPNVVCYHIYANFIFY